MPEPTRPVELIPLDDIGKAAFGCMARHDTPVAAAFEVWLDPRQKIYLCQAHAEDLMVTTAERIEFME